MSIRERIRQRRLRGRAARAVPSPLGACGWLPPRAEPPATQRLEGAEKADCAIIGAGFTGLAAARRLAVLQPDWRVAVIEAQTAGQGASGRSSGFVVDAASFIAAMPSDEADAFIRLSRAGIGALEDTVRQHSIDCDWDAHGFLHAAASKEGLESLARLIAWLEGRELAHEVLEPAALSLAVGTSYYRRAVRLPGSVLVDAGRLVRGLCAALPANVSVFERSPVVRLDPEYRIQASSGTLTAPRLVVALNAWSPCLGILPRRLLPLLTFGSLTRPLTEDEQRYAGAEETWGILAQDPMGASLRRTADQRLLVRCGLAYDRDVTLAPNHLSRAAAQHRRSLVRRFPELESVAFESTWAGPMGAVPNQRPFFGMIARQAIAIGGFSGAGIAMGMALGYLAAERLSGEKAPGLADIRRLVRPRRLPPEPFLSAGIRWRVATMNRRGGAAP